jgi:hypothetical protein
VEKPKKNSSTIFPISFVNKNKKRTKNNCPKKTLVSVCVWCVSHFLQAFLEFGTWVFFWVWFGLVCCCEKENCEILESVRCCCHFCSPRCPLLCKRESCELLLGCNIFIGCLFAPSVSSCCCCWVSFFFVFVVVVVVYL